MFTVLLIAASAIAVIYSTYEASAPEVMVTRFPCVKFERTAFVTQADNLGSVEWVGDHIVAHTVILENCCLDDFAVNWTLSGEIIQMNVKPLTTQTCRCMCTFAVNIDVGPLPVGTYHVQVFHGDVMVGEALV
jgi:hypothetical protein